MDATELRIDWDRQGMALPLLGAFVFVALGWWMLVMELDPASASRYDNPFFVRGAGLASVLFFGACALMGSWMITRPSPAFRLGPDGVEDRASLVHAGLIPWSELEGVRLVSAMGQLCLAFDVRDPEKLVAGARPWLRPIARANLRKCGTPVVLATQFLRGHARELLDDSQRMMARHAPASTSGER